MVIVYFSDQHFGLAMRAGYRVITEREQDICPPSGKGLDKRTL